MEHFQELSELALGSRLKRLSDVLMKDTANVYKAFDIDFEPKWFPIVTLLRRESPLGITDIAQRLSVSHPAISQLTVAMKKKDMITEIRDCSDERKRLIKLSTKAESMLAQLDPVWNDLCLASGEAIADSNFDLLGALEEYERSLKKKSLQQRVHEISKKRHFDKTKIIDFKEEYALEFAGLNYEWLEKYFTIEEHDIEMLSDPKSYIIDRGGQVLLAEYDGEIVGTVALLNIDERTYELVKMAVTEKAQGKQIGKKLMKACVEKSIEAGKKEIVLESSRKLGPAIDLYRKTGFEVIPLDSGTSYQRCDIRMRLNIANYYPDS